jgi:CRISPR system Cascade subunit CasC
MSNIKREHQFVEIHIIQSFAVSCLNRDQANIPKWCTFGGARRARVSSQSWKYAMRHDPLFAQTTGQDISARTQFLIRELTERLTKQPSKEELGLLAETFVGAYLGPLEKNKQGELLSKVLVFLSADEMDEMATALADNWNVFLADARAIQAATAAKAKKKGRGAKVQPDDAAEAIEEGTPELQTDGQEDADSAKTELGKLANRFKQKFSERVSAADIALFGRMLAEGNAAKKIEAACQVAHSVSTHVASPQDDFFTAMDDLQRAEDVGGGAMIGNLDFAAPCLYRYGRLDWEELKRNMTPRDDLVRLTAEAFISTFIKSIPVARQNSMPSPTMPSFVMAVVRSGGEGWSLANAFEESIAPRGDRGLVVPSIKALDEQWQLVRSGFDEDPTTVKRIGYMVKTRQAVELPNIANKQDTAGKLVVNVDSVRELVKDVMEHLTGA